MLSSKIQAAIHNDGIAIGNGAGTPVKRCCHAYT